MLYSIGKDSSVTLHLATKAFCPSKPPFPLLHVDTTCKFREMYDFRDRCVREFGKELIVHANHKAIQRGINPLVHGSAVHTDSWKTQDCDKRSTNTASTWPSAGARRDEEKSRRRSGPFRSTRRSIGGTRSC